MTTTSYTIGELAKEFDITARTIRFYGDKGLLSPERQGRQRIYTPKDRTTLALILRGKRIGFSLDESLELIKLYDPTNGNSRQLQTLIQKIQQRREILDRQMNDIKTLKKDLDQLSRRCLEELKQLDQDAAKKNLRHSNQD